MNAAILSDSGGTCVCSTNDLCIDDPVYLACIEDLRRELITTTAAISALASSAMGLIANLPVGLAPGLGLDAYVRDVYIDWLDITLLMGWLLRAVDLLDCRIPRVGPDNLPRSHGSCVYGRVSWPSVNLDLFA